MKNAMMLLVTFVFAAQVLAQEAPGMVWWSAPVEPGEYVQLHGGAWGNNPIVEIAKSADFRGAHKIIPVQVTETGICFEVPQKMAAGLMTCRVVSEGGASEVFVLNEPEVWWVHGDLGESASPGGWVRFFGRCLSRDGGASVKLVSEKGKEYRLKLTKKDVWSLDAPLPENFPLGIYTAHVSNGSGGSTGWRKAGKVEVRAYGEVWKKDVFNVADFGAIANDGFDDTIALQATLAAAAANGGGIVYLPRGRFQCNAKLVIPPYTLLRGVSKDESQLYWPDMEEPPEALIEGSHSFGIEDLFIHAGKYRQGIVCQNDMAGKHELGSSRTMLSHDITIRRVCFKLLTDQWVLRNTAEYEKRAYMRGNGIVARDVRFIRVEDCDIYCSKEGSSTLYFVLTGEYVKISGCRINGSGWAVVGGDKVIFERNDANNCTYSVSAVSRNLYWGENAQHDLYTNNREAITHDGAKVAFAGTVGATCDGLKMNLIFEDNKPVYHEGEAAWVGYDLQLIDGKGAGQTRTIKSITNGTDIVIDRPWTIQPDATSRYVVAAERKRLIYVDNTTEDTGIAIQLYGGLTEGIVARNTCTRSGGFRGFGMIYHRIIPLWFVQYLDNRIMSGNSYRGPANELPSLDSVFEFSDLGRDNLVLTRTCLMRRCESESNANIIMDSANGLVERCTIRNTDVGIRSRRHAETLVLHDNRFGNVLQPLASVVQDKATIAPAKRILAALDGASAILGKHTPSEWKKIRAQLATATRHDETSAQELLTQALRTLSATHSEQTFDARLGRVLLGVEFDIRNWDGDTWRAMTESPSRTYKAPFLASLAKHMPTVTCTIEAAELDGWKIDNGTFDLTPGKMNAVNPEITSPEGPKGFFKMPMTCVFRGDDWQLKCLYKSKQYTENRILPWIITTAPASDNPKLDKANWTAAKLSPHGEIEIEELPSNKTAIACAMIRVTRPTSLSFTIQGNAHLFIDARRVTTDLSRGNQCNIPLDIGDHVLKIIPRPTDKKDKDTPLKFKLLCNTSDAVQPGDFTFLPVDTLLTQTNALK